MQQVNCKSYFFVYLNEINSILLSLPSFKREIFSEIFLTEKPVHANIFKRRGQNPIALPILFLL